MKANVTNSQMPSFSLEKRLPAGCSPTLIGTPTYDHPTIARN